MTKNATAGVMGLAAALAVLLAFSASRVTQAASAPVTRWQATLAGNGATLEGDGNGVYVGGVDGVSITYGRSTCGSGKDKTYYSYLEMRVALPRQVRFIMPAVTDWWGPAPPTDPVPGFPGIDSEWPANLLEFLGKEQPSDGYEYVNVRFATCGCDDRTSTDVLQMPVGSSLRASVLITVFSRSQTCPQEDPPNTDYNLFMRAHGFQTTTRGLDVFIRRDSASTWSAHVDSLLDNPDYQNVDYALVNDFIAGVYTNCVLKVGRGGNISYGYEYIEAAAKAPLKFDLTFTKY